MAPHPLPQSWPSPSPTPTIAHYSGTLQWHHVHSPKVGRYPPRTIAHYNGTLQWHHWSSPFPRNDSALQWHLAMAPSNGTTSTPPKLVVTLSPRTIAHYNGTLQWHHWSSPSPRNDSALQWHLAMAPSNGTTSTPPKLVVTLSPNHSTLQWHPTMAQQWHHVLCTLQWHPGATSNPPKWFVALPPYWK